MQKIVAVSDVTGGIYSPEGLNIDEVIRHVKSQGSLSGFPEAQSISNDDLLGLEVDVLAPCALDGAIDSNNVDMIKAKIIVEGANGPVTANASKILHEKGVMVVPDILANGGGVVVSYFEWVQDLIWLFWSENEVRSKLKSIMYNSFDKVWEFAQKEQKNMRVSAMSVSLMRLEKAMKLRGHSW